MDGHQFELVDINVYFNDGTEMTYKTKQKNAYKDNCNKIFKTCLGANNGLNGSDIFDVEVELMNNYNCTVVKENIKSNYKRVTKEEALKEYGFDWDTYSKCLGFKTPPAFFITGNLNYLKCTTDSLLKNWKSPKWRTYWIFILLKRLCRFTNEWEKIIYEFYGNFQRGEEGINNSDAVSASLYMSVPFNNFLTSEYIKNNNSPPTNRLTEVLCNDLKKCFKRILETNTWISPITKQKALHKLSQFRFIVGHYNKEMPDPTLPYTNILYENMQLVSNWRHKTWVSLEGKKERPMPMMDWMDYPVKMTGTQAYIVNASYTPSKNAIYINLGYMQEPFIDFKKGLEYNLAHLGFTIGHEMSHGFDDMGSKYNGKGKLDNWWTPKDAEKFKQKQKEVIAQYELFAKRDKIYYNAAIGIGEDMADISGLGIVLLYLRIYNQFIKNSDSIAKLSFEKFFVYFAEQQKQKINKQAISAQLKTNPHPLNKYRCNIPLSRSDIFSVLYNVKKGDGMYWPSKNFIWY
jgi:predicted metalloendopeptidase